MGMIIYVVLSYCFCWIWLWNWFVFELSVCDGLKLLYFRYLWTCFVITMCTLMYEVLVNYLWNGCNMWLFMLNYYDLGCVQVGLKSFTVSVDYRVYMDSSMTVWSLRWLLLYLCSYKLVGSITLSLSPSLPCRPRLSFSLSAASKWPPHASRTGLNPLPLSAWPERRR